MKAQIISTHGDVNPIEHGGGVVRRDEEGYSWWEYCRGAEYADETGEITVYRVCIGEWEDPAEYFSWIDRAGIESFIGEPLPAGTDVDAWCDWISAVESYHGADELDSYPERFTESELRKRWQL